MGRDAKDFQEAGAFQLIPAALSAKQTGIVTASAKRATHFNIQLQYKWVAQPTVAL